MTNEEIAKLVADSVSKSVADRINESRTVAAEANVGKGAADVLAAAAKAGTVDQARAARGFDPHGGKGLNLAKLIIADAMAKANHTRPVDEAKRLGYTAVAKALSEGSFADGGSLVNDQISAEFIEIFRPAMVCLASGAREVPFKGSLSFGRQNATGSAAWQGEQANVALSGLTTGQLQLAAKKLAAATVISNDLLRNPNVSVEAMVRDDLAQVMARKLDQTLLEAVGSQYSPAGLDQLVATANQFAIAGVTLADKVADLGKAIRLVESSDVPMTSCGWVMHPRTKWALITQLDSMGNFVFADEISRGMLMGYPIKTTTALTASGSNYKIYFGEWSELILGVDTGMNIETLPNAAYHNGASVVAGASTDETLIRAIGRYDAVLRHQLSFSIITGVSY